MIDGVLDTIWNALPAHPIANRVNGTIEGPEDFSGRWWGLWDNQRFYFFIEIHDQWLEDQAGGADIWRNDIIEAYFNMDNAKPGGSAHTGDNYQYAFHWNKPNGQYVNNSTWTGVQWTQVTTDFGYVMEISIPWTTLTNRTIVEGLEFGFDLAANDNDGKSTYDSVTYWHNPGPASLWGNIDGAGTVALGALFDGNYAPVLEDLPIQEASEGTPSSIIVTATDLNPGDTIELSAEGLPTFASFVDNGDRTATITINATTGDANIYTFTLGASDGARDDSAQVILIVRDPAIASQLPTWTDVQDLEVNRGESAFVDLTVTDLDSLAVSIAGVGLPSWVTISDYKNKSGRLKISPTTDVDPGVYTLTVRATDDDDNVVDMEIGVTVTDNVPRTEFYLDPVNGSLANNGSPEHPWPSLSQVIEAGKVFSAGDRIYLLSGEHGSCTLTENNSDTVYLTAADGADPVLTKLTLASSSSNWHISKLTITPSVEPPLSSSTIVYIAGRNVVISDCFIYTVLDTAEWSATDWVGKAYIGVSVANSNNTIEDTYFLNVNHGIDLGNSNFITARRNTIKNFSGDGIRSQGNDILVEYNYIADCYNVDDNHDDGYQAWTNGSSGIGTGVISRHTIRNNMFIEATNRDRPHRGPLQGIGLFDGMYEDFVIENNVIVVDQWNGIAMYGGINSRIVNNTVIDLAPEKGNSPWITIEPNKFYSSSTGDLKTYYYGRDNVVANNLATDITLSVRNGGHTEDYNNMTVSQSQLDTFFVNHPYDLRLKAGAPAVDAGIREHATPFDIDGITRPIGTAPDIGAYEYHVDWNGYPASNNWAYTGKYLGWIHVERAPWVYQAGTGQWLYIAEATATDYGTWIYAPGLVPAGSGGTRNNIWAGYPVSNNWVSGSPLGPLYRNSMVWLYSNSFQSWFYCPGQSVSADGTWIYVLEGNPETGSR